MSDKEILSFLFESSVISYGSQTIALCWARKPQFESSVISYGSQTSKLNSRASTTFESSVISYGSQTMEKLYR